MEIREIQGMRSRKSWRWSNTEIGNSTMMTASGEVGDQSPWLLTVPCSLLSSRDSHPEVQQALLGHLSLPALSVLIPIEEQRVIE